MDQVTQITNTTATLLDRVIAFISQITVGLGNTLGIQIGTTGTAIAVLAAAIFFGKRMPSKLKWLLIIIGIVMLAGGSANVIQMIKGIIGQ
jgi:cytochrome c biogenesis protein CcdA